MKITVIILCFLVVIFLFFNDPFNKFLNTDVCLDTSYCKQGLTLNIDGIEQEINKTTCENNNGIWNEKKGYCKFKN